MKRRRSVKLSERLQPCQFCNHPISQRHHALPVSMFGENEFTLQLCANCHELYHVVERVVIHKSADSRKLLAALIDCFGENDVRLQKTYHFIAAALRIFGGTQ